MALSLGLLVCMGLLPGMQTRLVSPVSVFRAARSPVECSEVQYLNATTSACQSCDRSCTLQGCVGPNPSDCRPAEEIEGEPSTGIIVFGVGFLLACCMVAFVMSWCFNQRTKCAAKEDVPLTLTFEQLSAAGGGGRQACSRVTSMDLDNEVLTLASRSARRTPSIQAKDARTVAGRVPSPVALTPRMSPIEENVTSAIRESREKYQERKAVGLQSLDATPIPTPTGTPPNWADGHMPSHPPSTLSRTALRTAMAADDVALATQIIAATETEV